MKNQDEIIRIDDITLSPEALRLTWREGYIDFSEKEFELLYFLMSAPGTLFTKRQIMKEVWEGSEAESLIKAYIYRLRKKLKNCDRIHITSVRAKGYMADIRIKSL